MSAVRLVGAGLGLVVSGGLFGLALMGGQGAYMDLRIPLWFVATTALLGWVLAPLAVRPGWTNGFMAAIGVTGGLVLAVTLLVVVSDLSRPPSGTSPIEDGLMALVVYSIVGFIEVLPVALAAVALFRFGSRRLGLLQTPRVLAGERDV